MRAMLLAAGRGERMLPLTLTVPKPAVPVLGRPLAVQILHRLAMNGITRAAVNLHHLAERIRSLLGDGRDLGLEELHYSYEEEILGTAGGIGRAASFLRDGKTILVHNADFLSDIDISDAIAAHLASGCPATLVLAPLRPGYTPIAVGPPGRVTSIGPPERAGSGEVRDLFMFTGLQVLDEAILDRIAPDRPSDIVSDVLLDLVDRRQVAYHVHEGFWWDFGTPEHYLAGSIRLLEVGKKRLPRIARTDPVSEIGETRAAIGPGAEWHSGVILRGRVALGLACMVAEGCRIEDSMIMPEAWIGPGSRLRRAIIAPGTEIPADSDWEDALVCADPGPEVGIPPGVEREGGLLVRRLERTPV